MDSIEIGQVTEVAKGISDFGMMAITAGFFLVLSGVLWLLLFRWFKGIIDNVINSHDKTVKQLLEETKQQNIKLDTIKEGLKPELMQRIKVVSNSLFDLYGWHIMDIINRVRKENHVVDREKTIQKINLLITNEFGEVNSKLDSFVHHGSKLSTFTNKDWIRWASDVVTSEIYNENGPNSERAYTNVNMVIDRIKIDFYHHIIN